MDPLQRPIKDASNAPLFARAPASSAAPSPLHPLTPSPAHLPPHLVTPSPCHPVSSADTRKQAGAIATRSITRRHAQILQLLQDRGPLTLWEIAGIIGVHDHQISGRITELLAQGQIEPTGDTKPNPATGAPARLYRLPQTPTPSPQTPNPSAIPDAIGYPPELRIDGDLYHRCDREESDPWPGQPYRRHTQGDRPALEVRLILLLCPACGSPVHLYNDTSATPPRKLYRCPTPDCPGAKGYKLQLVTPSGHSDHLALVLQL